MDINKTPVLPPSVSNEPPHGRFRGLADSIRQAVLQGRLVWNLFMDRRVSILLKIVPIAGIAYVLFPLDFIPDFIPVLGQMDDLGIFLASAWLFVDLCPKAIVSEHWQALITGTNAAANPPPSEEKASQKVIDVSPKDSVKS